MQMSARAPLASLPQNGFAIVKSVQSGDTCTLISQVEQPLDVSSLPSESLFSLSNLVAPRLPSEAGADASREFLRELIIGQMVKFHVTKSATEGGGGRAFGNIQVQVNGTPVDVNLLTVEKGFTTVKNIEKLRTVNHELISPYEKSLLVSSGIQCGEDAPPPPPTPGAGMDFVRPKLISPSPACPLSLLASSAPLQVLVEHIFDPTRYKLLVVGPPSSPCLYATFTGMLGGCKPAKRDADTGVLSPVSQGGKNFLERRILNRVLECVIGVDEGGSSGDGHERTSALVALKHESKGDLSKIILSMGLCPLAEWSLRLCQNAVTGDGSEWGSDLRTAEGNARKQQIGMFKPAPSSSASLPPAPPGIRSNGSSSSGTASSSFNGICVEAVTGDTIVVLVNDKFERRVTLSSIRAPRVSFGGPNGGDSEPYGYECRETLRKLIVGKGVSVRVDYTKTFEAGPNGPASTKEFATVNYQKNARAKSVDVGEHLVALGYAKVLIPRGDDKSSHYQALVNAEAETQKSKTGVFSKKEYISPELKITNLEEPSKAKSYSSFVQRSSRRLKRIKGVVENVFGPTRFKVRLIVPGEKGKGGAEILNVTLSLVGIRTPMRGEQFAEEGKLFARKMLNQREIEIDFIHANGGAEVCNQKGMFVGGIYVKDVNFAAAVVKAGLGSIDEWFRERGDVEDATPYYKELIASELEGKGLGMNLWANYEENSRIAAELAAEASVEKAQEEEAAGAGTDEKQTVRITEVTGSTFYAQLVSSDGFCKALADIKMGLQQFNGGVGASTNPNWLRKNAFVLHDGQRGKVSERVEANSTTATVFLPDTGATITTSTKSLKPLAGELTVLKKYPFAAKKFVLQGVSVRSSEAAEATPLVIGKTEIKICGSSDDGLLCILYNSDGISTVNEALVSACLGFVPKVKKNKWGKIVDEKNVVLRESSELASLVESMIVSEEKAKRSRDGIWRYGDIAEEDEDSNNF